MSTTMGIFANRLLIQVKAMLVEGGGGDNNYYSKVRGFFQIILTMRSD